MSASMSASSAPVEGTGDQKKLAELTEALEGLSLRDDKLDDPIQNATPAESNPKTSSDPKEAGEERLTDAGYKSALFLLFFAREDPKSIFERTVEFLFEEETFDEKIPHISSANVRKILDLPDDSKITLRANAEKWESLLLKDDEFLNCLIECLEEILVQFVERVKTVGLETGSAFEYCEALRKRSRSIINDMDKRREARLWLQRFAGGIVQVWTDKPTKISYYHVDKSRTILPFERIFLSLVLVDPQTMRGFSVGQEPKFGVGVSGIAVKDGDLNGGCNTVIRLNAELQKRDPKLCVTNLYQRGVVCWNLYPAEGASIENNKKVHQPQSSMKLFKIIREASGNKPIAFWGGARALDKAAFEGTVQKTIAHISMDYVRVKKEFLDFVQADPVSGPKAKDTEDT